MEKNKAGTGRRAAWFIAFVMLIVCAGTYRVYAASVTVGSAIGYVDAKGGAYLRSKPSTSSDKVTLLDDDTRFYIKKEIFTSKTSSKKTDRWFYVYCGSRKGYIRSDIVDGVTYSETPARTNSTVNIRKGPSTNMQISGTLGKSKKLTVVLPVYCKDSNDVWYKFKDGKKYYFVSGKRVKLLRKYTSIGLKDMLYPEELLVGDTFSIGGIIEANKDISKVEIRIINSKGKIVQNASSEPSVPEFKLSALDSSIRFAELPKGKYTYAVDVTVDGKTYTKVYRSFKVKAAEGASAISQTALKLAWPEGTAASRYTYGASGAKSTSAFMAAFDKVFPTHNKWGKGPSKGASCDVFVATIIRTSGYDKDFPRGLAEQWPYMRSSAKWKEVTDFNRTVDKLKNGDVIIYNRKDGGHIFIYYNMNGKEGYAEAGYCKTYGHLVKGRSAVQAKLGRKYIKKIAVYRAVS